MIIAIAVSVSSVIFGIMTKIVADKKNYKYGFWWGFLFNVIGLLYVIIRDKYGDINTEECLANGTRKKLTVSTIFKKYLGITLALVLEQVLLRVIALLPLVFADKFPFEWMGITLTAVLYLFLVLPLRYRAYAFPGHAEYGFPIPQNWYGKYLTASVRRVATGLIWGLPFFLTAGAWYYAFTFMAMPDFFNILSKLGGLAGGKFDAGIMIWLGAIVLFGILFAYGWWREMPKDYIPINQVGKSFAKANRIRRKNKGAFWKSMVINVLLTLPSVIAVIGVFANYYMGSINFSAGAFAAAQRIMTLIKLPLPSTTLLYLATVVLIIHVPLCVIRKLRNAVLVANLAAK